MVDSTRLTERVGDARSAEVWAEHHRRARLLLVEHRGLEIDRTDGLFLLFAEAGHAARYALAYHAGLAGIGLGARIGLHAGPVILRENSAEAVALGAKRVEVEGLAKPLAARIMGLSRGGQTLLSAAARDAIGASLPDGSELESHGHYRLKGIEDPVEVFELGRPGAGAFVPPADVDKAYRVVRAAELWRPVRELRNNLLAERDTFVGRTGDLRRLSLRLDDGARLVTVLGTGGTGKTRLARRYGRVWLWATGRAGSTSASSRKRAASTASSSPSPRRAREKLQASGSDALAAEQRHGRHFAGFGARRRCDRSLATAESGASARWRSSWTTWWPRVVVPSCAGTVTSRPRRTGRLRRS